MAHFQRWITLQTIDGLLISVLDTLKAKLKDPALKDVVFVLVSDHGHTPVTADLHHQVTSKEIKEALEKSGWKGYTPAREGEVRDSRAEQGFLAFSNFVTCVNDGMVHFYVKNRSGKGWGWGWDKPPRFCEDIIPFAHEVGKTPFEIVGGPSYIMKRNKPGTNSADQMILVKDRGVGRYKVYTGRGSNPNCYAVAELGVYFKPSEIKALESLYSGDTPESLRLGDAGDVVILTNFEGEYDTYDSLVVYCCITGCDELLRSDHGNILDSDRLIPFVIFGEKVKEMPFRGEVCFGSNSFDSNQVNVAPTVAVLLGFPMSQVDGKNILAATPVPCPITPLRR